VPTPTAAVPANDQIRNRLKAIRAQIDGVRDQRATLIKDRDDAKAAFATADIDISAAGAHDTPEFKAAEEAVRALGEADDQLADLQATERGLLGMLGETSPPDRGGNGPGAHDEDSPLRAWDGRRLLAGDAYQGAVDRGLFTSSAQFGSVVLGEVAAREQFQEFLAASARRTCSARRPPTAAASCSRCSSR
jgi:hypothetical protein